MLAGKLGWKDILLDKKASKFTKTKALNQLQTTFTEQFEKQGHNSLDEIIECLLLGIEDKFESCRETSAQLMLKCAETFPTNHREFWDKICSRIMGDFEDSEQVLKIEILILVVIEKWKTLPDLSLEMVTATIETLLRNRSPDILKAACLLVAQVSPRLDPKQDTAHVGKLVNPLVKLLGHKHSAVRQSVLRGLCSILCYAPFPLDDHVFVDSLNNIILLEKSPAVKKELYIQISFLLKTMREKYSYASYLLPFLLIGVTDEFQDLSALAEFEIILLGRQYEQDYWEKLKDELDYAVDYPGRPSVGCRHFVLDNMKKLVKFTLDCLNSWNSHVRLNGLKLTKVVLKFTENLFTGHVGSLLSVLFRMSDFDDREFHREFSEIAQLFSKFIDSSIVYEVAIPLLSLSSSTKTKVYVLTFLRESKPIDSEVDVSFLLDEFFKMNEDTLIIEEYLKLVDEFKADILQNTQALHTVIINLLVYSAEGRTEATHLIPFFLNYDKKSFFFDKFLPFCENSIVNSNTLKYYGVAREFLLSCDDIWTEAAFFVLCWEKCLKPLSTSTFEDQWNIPARKMCAEILEKKSNELFFLFKDDQSLFQDVFLSFLVPNIQWYRGAPASIIRKSCLHIFLFLLNNINDSNLDFIKAQCKHEVDNYRTFFYSLIYALDDDFIIENKIKAGEVFLKMIQLGIMDDLSSVEIDLLVQALSKSIEDETASVRLNGFNLLFRLSCKHLLTLPLEETIRKTIVHLDDENSDIQESVQNFLISCISNRLVSASFVSEESMKNKNQNAANILRMKLVEIK